ncbi:hypothetical protein REPUB_Repub17cG0194800 [Reevesia pubescens]
MATLSSPPSILSSSSTAKTPQPKSPQPNSLLFFPKPLATALTTALATTTLLTSTPPSIAAQPPTYHMYYGTAASAANYGGYGGNSDKKASAEYVYDVPDGWKRAFSFQSGKGHQWNRQRVLQSEEKTRERDLIAGADSLVSEEKKDENGQLYYVYEIDGIGKHSLIAITCAKNKLYAHFVNAPALEWKRDEDTLRHIHQSFKTVEPF